MLHAIGAQEFEIPEDYSNSIDYNENFNRDRYDKLTKETDVLMKEKEEQEQEQLDYSDYGPEAAALMEVEEMEPEEKKGPTLGRVLGVVDTIFFYIE